MKVGSLTVSPHKLIDRIDSLWGCYECEIEFPDGRIVAGTIEGDGHYFADTTLTDEDGNPFPTHEAAPQSPRP